MRRLRWGLVLCLAMGAGAGARAGEHAGGAQKLKLVSVSASPDPFSPAAKGTVSIQGDFESRPTDAGAGKKENGKTFAIRMTITITDSAGQTVRELDMETTFGYPEDLPASQYHAVSGTTSWDGKDSSGSVVDDGTYTYTVQGTLVRYDKKGNVDIQEHLVGASGTVSGTVKVDSTPPEIELLAPLEPATVPRPTIIVRITDICGVDATSIKVLLDGADVTPPFDPATGELIYDPDIDLASGTHKVLATARDFAGNETTRLLTFEVMLLRNPITVGPGGSPDYDFASIQEAVDALNAQFGGQEFPETWEIIIEGGDHYYGSVTVPESLHSTADNRLVICSAGDDPVYLYGSGTSDVDGVEVRTGHVTLSNFRIENFWYGVDIATPDEGCVLEDVTCRYNHNDGFHSESSAGADLVRCTAEYNYKDGMDLSGGEWWIEDCQIEGNSYDGLTLSCSASAVLERNMVQGYWKVHGDDPQQRLREHVRRPLLRRKLDRGGGEQHLLQRRRSEHSLDLDVGRRHTRGRPAQQHILLLGLRDGALR
jgi:hypothetical protein